VSLKVVERLSHNMRFMKIVTIWGLWKYRAKYVFCIYPLILSLDHGNCFAGLQIFRKYWFVHRRSTRSERGRTWRTVRQNLAWPVSRFEERRSLLVWKHKKWVSWIELTDAIKQIRAGFGKSTNLRCLLRFFLWNFVNPKAVNLANTNKIVLKLVCTYSITHAQQLA